MIANPGVHARGRRRDIRARDRRKDAAERAPQETRQGTTNEDALAARAQRLEGQGRAREVREQQTAQFHEGQDKRDQQRTAVDAVNKVAAGGLDERVARAMGGDIAGKALTDHQNTQRLRDISTNERGNLNLRTAEAFGQKVSTTDTDMDTGSVRSASRVVPSNHRPGGDEPETYLTPSTGKDPDASDMGNYWQTGDGTWTNRGDRPAETPPPGKPPVGVNQPPVGGRFADDGNHPGVDALGRRASNVTQDQPPEVQVVQPPPTVNTPPPSNLPPGVVDETGRRDIVSDLGSLSEGISNFLEGTASVREQREAKSEVMGMYPGGPMAFTQAVTNAIRQHRVTKAEAEKMIMEQFLGKQQGA